MGKITQFAAEVQNDQQVSSTSWFSDSSHVTAKVYINSIFAQFDIVDGTFAGMIPWKRFRMSVTNGSNIVQNNIVTVDYRHVSIAGTVLPTTFAKGVNPDNGTNYQPGRIALEMVGGCGSSTMEYAAGQFMNGTTQEQIMQLQHNVIGTVLTNTTLSGSCKMNVTVTAKSGTDLYKVPLMFISYHVPEYFYLNKNDVLKVHNIPTDTSARLLFTVVTE